MKIRINQRDTTIHVQIVNKSQTIILPHRNLFQITVGIANKGRQLDRTDPSSYLNQKINNKISMYLKATNRIFKTFITFIPQHAHTHKVNIKSDITTAWCIEQEMKTIAVNINRPVILIFMLKLSGIISKKLMKYMKYNTQLSNSAQSLNTDSKNQLI